MNKESKKTKNQQKSRGVKKKVLKVTPLKAEQSIPCEPVGGAFA